VTCAISWGLCSLIGLLAVMSVVVVLVLLLYSFPVDGVGVGVWGVPVHLFFVVCHCFLFLDRLRLVYFCNYEIGSFMFCRNSLSIAACLSVKSCINYTFFVRRLPISSRSFCPCVSFLSCWVNGFPQLSYF